MIDIEFYRQIHPLKQAMLAGERPSRKTVIERLEACRSKTPVVYNIETTNACNMRCRMCPRTTLMTRPIASIDLDLFERIADQLRPHSSRSWNTWVEFAERTYGVDRHVPSENNFFLFVIPRVVVLHGYGDPLLDRHMAARVAMLRDREIPSYFSCNPANLNLDRAEEMMENGLGYIKFSVESTDDQRHRAIRGERSDFTVSYENILELLRRKAHHDHQTTVVITMLDLSDGNQATEFEALGEAFRDQDVYLYLKSMDQHWYQDQPVQTRSIHWIEFCQFPWSSMTIKSNGEAVQCVEDYDNEIVLGDTRHRSLAEIWNGEAYARLRRDHLALTPEIKCSERCDMKLAGALTCG